MLSNSYEFWIIDRRYRENSIDSEYEIGNKL
ncbi:hypothetical protein FVB9288_02283 [Flavobacterium sp. CECT 9288]|nr:hypothetical protein FVB9288_02283 [Flavobacterium sp. CECT 9288]